MKIPDVAFMAIFCGAVLVCAVISIAAVSIPADAARNAYRYPPYGTGTSSPNQTCTSGTYYQLCAVRDDSTGKARIYSKSASNSWRVAIVEHNNYPLNSNPSLTLTSSNYYDIVWTNGAKGKFHIADNNNYASAILRVGGWSTYLRQLDQVWLKDKAFYTEYNGLYLSDGEYVIPYTNHKKTWAKNNNPGVYGITAFAEARTYGSAPPNIIAIGTVDAYTDTKGYLIDSEVLSLECAYCP
jgi:hypothetical protein